MLGLITHTLLDYNLDHSAIVSQCYDAASVMSGHLSCVQKTI